MNDIKYIGDNTFTITEDRLKELLEHEVRMELYDANVDSPGSYMFGIESMYPGYGETPYDVADKMISDIIDAAH